MNPACRILGYRRYRIAAQDATAVLELCREACIVYGDFRVLADGDCTLVCRLSHGKRLEYGCAVRQIPLTVIKSGGMLLRLRALLARPGLCAGILCAAVLSAFSGHYVWFVRVSGNRQVSDTQIRALLREAGVYVGACFDRIDIDRAEATLLLGAQELSWVTVNRSGTVAEVQVRERQTAPAAEGGYANVVASRTGVVEYVRLTSGNAVVRAGDVVQKGEVLISGLYDSQTVGFRAVRAAGEVYARSADEFFVRVPLVYEKKVYTGEKQSERYVNFFGKVINLSKRTGNIGGSCDTIESVGEFGFVGCPVLPVSYVRRTYEVYTTEEATRTDKEALTLAYYELNRQIAERIGDGMLLSKTVRTDWTADACVLYCRIEGVFNIGQTCGFELLP